MRAITPDMTIAQLLESYPGLDETLGRLAPPWAGLTSGAVRTAVARNTTLQQLSVRGGTSLGTLMNGLRQAAGVDAPASDAEDTPAWVAQGRVATRFDATATLASGGHPLQRVMDEVETIGDGLYELVTPFVPGPLIELVRGKGYDAFTRNEGESVHTYFRRAR